MELYLNVETCEYNMQKKRIRWNAMKAITTTSPNEKYTQMSLHTVFNKAGTHYEASSRPHQK